MRSPSMLVLLLLLGSCSAMTLDPVTPPSSTAVGSVNVEYDAALDGKKASVLDRHNMKVIMTQALANSFQAGSGETLHVTITQFRTGGYGPTRMHAKAELRDASGATVKSTEADSTSAFGNLQGVAQQVVEQIVAGI
jgi:hypothetical protein